MAVLLPQPLESRDYRRATSHLAQLLSSASVLRVILLWGSLVLRHPRHPQWLPQPQSDNQSFHSSANSDISMAVWAPSLVAMRLVSSSTPTPHPTPGAAQRPGVPGGLLGHPRCQRGWGEQPPTSPVSFQFSFTFQFCLLIAIVTFTVAVMCWVVTVCQILSM